MRYLEFFFIYPTVRQQHSISSNTKSFFVCLQHQIIIHKRDNYSIYSIDVHTIISKV